MIQFLFEKTPLKFFVQSFWRDEAFSYLVAKRDFVEIAQLTAQDFSPPLYYFVLNLWMQIFGTSEIAIRSLSFIFFWATAYVFFHILIDVLKINKRSAHFYILLFILNPLLNYYAFEARPYSLFAFLVTASFYFLMTKRYRLYTASLLLGLYTHYFMFLVILSQLVVIGKKQFRSIFLALAGFAPWIIYFFLRRPDLASGWIEEPNRLTILNLPAIIYTGFESYAGTTYDDVLKSLTLILLLIIGIRFGELKKVPLLVSWAALPSIIAIIISFHKPLFLPRYLIFSAAGLLVLLIYILNRLKLVQRIILLSVLVILTLNYNHLQIKHRVKGDIRKVVQEIKTLAGKDDLLYVRSELDFHSAQYYFGEEKVFIYDKSYSQIPPYVGRVLIPRQKVITNLPHFPKKAFILNTDYSYEIQSGF